MEDGGSPLIGLIVFVILMLLDAVLYGFSIAVDNLNDSQIDKKAEEGNQRAIWIQQIKDSPYKVRHILQLMMTLIGIILGIYQGRMYGRMIIASFLGEEQSFWIQALCYVVITFAMVFLLTVFGILIPQKIAIRKAEKWAFSFAGIVRSLVIIFSPLAFLAEKLSNLAVHICGMDPNENLDDVTEEEIISMVNEGHEQGVLQASEAEMIHNIFEFCDKEAKDIMTHRKNVIAVDGNMKLSEAMEYMLEKNNSRFPVYKEDIDNIVGIVHIKDAMIQSRDKDKLMLPLCLVPNLVREVSFIPETRNINSLFQSMQSQKNHMVIVVDEYGQTAGLVAMEDILEEIVGNILDEYDEEDNMIMEQADGSYLMKGMAPLDEVCEILKIEESELEDYDTLNGYLISLIDKIPGDHEVFEIRDRGYLFHVLSVENKIIQTVRVMKIQQEEDSEENSACQDKKSVVE